MVKLQSASRNVRRPTASLSNRDFQDVRRRRALERTDDHLEVPRSRQLACPVGVIAFEEILAGRIDDAEHDVLVGFLRRNRDVEDERLSGLCSQDVGDRLLDSERVLIIGIQVLRV